ncbi:MAG: DUF6402 family protein [Bacteroidota bacterium]
MTLPFEHDEWITIAKLNGEEFTDCHFNIYGKDKTTNDEKVLLYTSDSRPLCGGSEFNLEHKITIDYLFYNEAAKLIAGSSDLFPTQIEFFWELVVNSEDQDGAVTTETEELEDTLTVHFVRYIPKLMNILGFVNGEKLQRIWFTRGNVIDRETIDPFLNIIDWDWLMKESEEVKDEYIEFKNDVIDDLNSTFTNKVSRSLHAEINKMIDEGLITKPTEDNPRVDFGIYDEKIITSETKRFPSGEQIPRFEKYYFKAKPFRGFFDIGTHYRKEGLDDFIATLASFNYHVLASGYLEFKKGKYLWSLDSYTQVNVTHLGFYIKDSFDFIDDPGKKSQPLGFWKILGKNGAEVERNLNKNGYYEVNNKLYRDYRDDHGMGYNFHLYSNINRVRTSIKLDL